MTDAPDETISLDATSPAESFSVVRFGGYDRHQVDDYLDRVEATFNDYDARLAEAGSRTESMQTELDDALERLTRAEQRVAGSPESASVLTERLAAMLRLAEQEAAELRQNAQIETDRLTSAARTEAEQSVMRAKAESEGLLTSAKEKASRESAERAEELQRREREVTRTSEAAEAATLQAQRDAEAVRAQAKRDADNSLTTARRESDAMRSTAKRDADNAVTQARQDVQLLHEQARREAANTTAAAEKELRAMQRQKEAISAQLQQLRDAVAAAVAPLAGEDDLASPAARPQVGRPQGGPQASSVRRDPSAPGSSN